MGARSGWVVLSCSASLSWDCYDRGHKVTALILKLSERHATYLLSWQSNGTLRTRQALDQNKALIRLSVMGQGNGWELRFCLCVYGCCMDVVYVCVDVWRWQVRLYCWHAGKLKMWLSLLCMAAPVLLDFPVDLVARSLQLDPENKKHR